jgi:biopolymer transport protein ExbD
LSKNTISLTVDENKRYFIDQREVSFDQLESSVLSEMSGNPEATIVLRLPHNLQIQDLVDVMQIGAKHKIKMVLATDKK